MTVCASANSVRQVDVNSTDSLRRTCLHKAALMGHTEVVRYLLADTPVKKELRAKDGKIAADLAKMEGHLEIVKLL